MSSSLPALPATRPPTFDRLAVLELLGEFVFTTPVFGIFTARVVDDAGSYDYTQRGLAVGFAIGAGIALALVFLTVWSWWRAGGRPAQRRAMRVWQSGVLPDSPPERALLLRALGRQERTLTRSRSFPTVAAVLWVLIAGFQIASARDPLTPVAWVLLAAFFVGQAILTRRQLRRLPQLEVLVSRLRSEEL